jgi:hypothetical protein
MSSDFQVSYIKITTKEWNFMLFVFVSLVCIDFVTTEKQCVKCDISEFCCCSQAGNINNVCWGKQQGGCGGSL